jgi:hypothetical protein
MKTIKDVVLKNLNLMDKVLPGFHYRNTPVQTDKDGDKMSRSVQLNTNSTGAKILIAEMRLVGLSDEYIGKQVQVLTDTDWKCLADVTIKQTIT